MGGCRARARGCQGLGFFQVGGVVAARAIHNGIFAGGGNHLELFAQIPANGAAVGRHRAVGQAKAVKNAPVGPGHDLVTGLGRGLIPVKTVGVFHDEFTPAHQAKAWAPLVAKLGLNLVKVLRQLFVAADFLAHDVGHHLFAGGLNHKVVRVAVLDAQQLGAHLFKPAGLGPQLGRLHQGHGQLDGAGTVHFFAHDGLHFAHHTQAHRHQGVNASTNFFDHAGTHHELVAGNFGIRRGFFEGGNKKLGGSHGISSNMSGLCLLLQRPRCA